MTDETLDVLIVGAGLAGIGFASHLKRACPSRSFRLLEARDRLGGTWDLFRYPGIRSDSAMHLYGYSFAPWREAEAIVPGDKILAYLEETAAGEGLHSKIDYNVRVTAAAWSSTDARWRVEALDSQSGDTRVYRCRWLQLCAGYYDYAEGYTPEFVGRDDFRGEIVHPQDWPDDLDVNGKRVVVIGSGATAITMVPSLCEQGARVTMLQRSPSYVWSEPAVDSIARWLYRILPDAWAYWLSRQRRRLIEYVGYRIARRYPKRFKAHLLDIAREELPDGYPIDRHFRPRYEPWDQRVCLTPDAEFFAALRRGDAEILTAEIERFTTDGIELRDGSHVPADLIVTATGLNMKVGGGISIRVDGAGIRTENTWIYRGAMFSGVPNLATANGSFVASYTLRVELISRFVCNVLNYMSKTSTDTATPTLPLPPVDMPQRPFVETINAGYVQRVADAFPKQGDSAPWLNPQTYPESRRVLSADVAGDDLAFTLSQAARELARRTLLSDVTVER